MEPYKSWIQMHLYKATPIHYHCDWYIFNYLLFCFKLWSLLQWMERLLIMYCIIWQKQYKRLSPNPRMQLLTFKHMGLLRRPENSSVAVSYMLRKNAIFTWSLFGLKVWLFNCSSERSYTFIDLVLSLRFFKPWKTRVGYEVVAAGGLF